MYLAVLAALLVIWALVGLGRWIERRAIEAEFRQAYREVLVATGRRKQKGRHRKTHK